MVLLMPRNLSNYYDNVNGHICQYHQGETFSVSYDTTLLWEMKNPCFYKKIQYPLFTTECQMILDTFRIFRIYEMTSIII